MMLYLRICVSNRMDQSEDCGYDIHLSMYCCRLRLTVTLGRGPGAGSAVYKLRFPLNPHVLWVWLETDVMKLRASCCVTCVCVCVLVCLYLVLLFCSFGAHTGYCEL